MCFNSWTLLICVAGTILPFRLFVWGWNSWSNFSEEIGKKVHMVYCSTVDNLGIILCVCHILSFEKKKKKKKKKKIKYMSCEDRWTD